MFKRKKWQQAAFSAFLIWSFLLNGSAINGQDIVVGSDDISSGSSAFVFRGSRKGTQVKAAFRKAPAKRNETERRATRKKVKTQLVKIKSSKPQRTKTAPPKKTPKFVPPPKKNVKPNPTQKELSDVFASGAETNMERGKTDEAIKLFRKALEFNSGNVNAKVGLSEALSVKGDEALDADDYQVATVYFEEASTLDEKNSSAFAGLGEIYDALGKSEQALIVYEKALSISPELSELFAPTGILYLQKGEVAKADAYLTKAITLLPNDSETQFFLGLTRYKQNLNQEALEAFKKSVQFNPTNAEAYYYLGETYDRLDKVGEAINAYNEAVKINPKFVEAWFDLGAAYYNRERYNEAIKAYQQVVELKNTYGEAYANLADIYRQKQEWESAISNYRLATSFIKNDNDLYSKFAYCLGKVGKWDAAVAELEKLPSAAADEYDYTNLSWAYYNSAKTDESSAIVEMRRGNQAQADKLNAQAKEKINKAKVSSEKAIKKNPKFVAALINLGKSLTDLTDYSGSVQAFLSVVQLSKDKNILTIANNDLGAAYNGLKDFNNAVRYLNAAIQLNDKFPSAYYNLGYAQYQLGDKDGYKKSQAKLKKLAPNLASLLEADVSGALVRKGQQKVEQKVKDKVKIPF